MTTSTPQPTAVPTAEDWLWAASVFRERGGFLAYSTSFAVRIHNRNVDMIRRLRNTFGGRVYAVAGTLQWRLAGEDMKVFLEGIKPLLVGEARADRVRALVEKALAKLEERPAKTRGEAVLDRVPSDLVTPATKRTRRKPEPVEGEESVAPVVSFLEGDEEAFGRVPPGPPWDAKQVLFELAADAAVFPDGMVLEAESEEQARAFASAAPRSLVGEASGLYVRLRHRR